MVYVRLNLSIKNAWYGLILLVVILPFIILLGWGGLVFHDVLLERSLQQEQVLQDMVHSSVEAGSVAFDDLAGK